MTYSIQSFGKAAVRCARDEWERVVAALIAYISAYLVAAMYPRPVSVEKKAQNASYDPDTGRWTLHLPPSEVETDKVLP